MRPLPCPYCDFPMTCDEVDIGVGFEQCGPYVCEACGACQMEPDKALVLHKKDPTPSEQEWINGLDDDEVQTHFYKGTYRTPARVAPTAERQE